jgi:hypothetical protein
MWKLQAVGEIYENRSREIVPALEGPNPRRVTPLGWVRSGGLCYPQVKTRGYPRLAPAGAGPKRLQ